MSLYQQWNDLAGKQRTAEEHDKFWGVYFEAEKKNYQNILEKKEKKIEGTLENLAEGFGMDNVTMLGFLDGINTSLTGSLELEGLVEDSRLELEIDFEKLYFNMLDAKAYWLYQLPEWDGILSEEKRNEITKDFNRSKTAISSKIGRNDPCPCGSGKKYKKCCGNA